MHFSRAVVSLTVIIWHKRIGEREEKDVNFVDVCISNASFAKLLYLLRVFYYFFLCIHYESKRSSDSFCRDLSWWTFGFAHTHMANGNEQPGAANE